MADVSVAEKTEEAPVILSPDEVGKAAQAAREEINKIFSLWEEYRKPRLINQGDTKEFQRSAGLVGEGLWEVNNLGGYSKYHLLRGVKIDGKNSSEEWEILLQPGGVGVWQNAVISAFMRRTKDGQTIVKESPDKNTRQALDLVVDFVRQINGGKTPAF